MGYFSTIPLYEIAEKHNHELPERVCGRVAAELLEEGKTMQKQKTLAYYTIFKCSFAALTTHMGLSRLPKLKPKGGLFSRASSAVVAVEKAAAFINCNELKRWGKERKEKRSSELI